MESILEKVLRAQQTLFSIRTLFKGLWQIFLQITKLGNDRMINFIEN